MIVVDMEASGLDPHKHSLLSIGAVDFERPDRQFYGECRIWDGAHIDPQALVVNGFSKEEASDINKKTDRLLVEEFLKWTEGVKDMTIAGQNPSADRDFIRATAERYHLDWKMPYRVIDLHSICYYHLISKGKEVPMQNNHSGLNLDKILNYVGLPDEPKPHNGLRGAKLEAEAFSRIFYGKNLLAEYSQYPIPDFNA